MLTIPQIAQTRQISPYLYESLNKIVSAINTLSSQSGVDAAPAAQAAAGESLPAPSAPASLDVSASAGTFRVTLGASPGATSAALYFLEAAADPGFAATDTTVYPLGGSLVANLSLGNVTLYFRARAKYPDSGYGPYVIFGGSTASAVTGGLIGSVNLPTNVPLNSTNNATVDSVDAGTSATIRIYGPGGVGSSWMRFSGQGTETYPGGTITGLAYSTVYYVVWNGSAYLAFTLQSQAVNDNYVFVGRPTTVAQGGSGGSSGGGGASGGGNGGRFLD
ncbi:MAG TPA: hypothetical protein VEG63_09765 [Candidatus Acidoferrales bacterium]|nr:hypothetical protein [Candidatus Acidoferrales bacterium]